jgi:DNA-binding transcriptional MerR regulator
MFFRTGGKYISIRPIDIARHLNISTSTLRLYEKKGLIPSVSRSPTGDRIYTEKHIAYFICIREMSSAFDLNFIAGVLKEVKEGHIDAALWVANKAQADLWNEKQTYKKAVEILLYNNFNISSSKNMTIGEISKETGIPITTIRYWEKVGLLFPKRNEENRYRIYTNEHIRQILTLNAIKLSVQTHRLKHFFRTMQETYEAFDYSNRDEIVKFLDNISIQLNQMNRLQIKSISALYKLCQQVETNFFEPSKK